MYIAIVTENSIRKSTSVELKNKNIKHLVLRRLRRGSRAILRRYRLRSQHNILSDDAS